MKKPKAVDLAVNALLISTLVDIAGSIVTGHRESGAWVVDACVYAFSVFLIFKIAKGKNWARVVTFAGFVLSVYVLMIFGMGAWAVSVGALPHFKGAALHIRYPYVHVVAGILDMLLTGYALWLLFTNPVCEWFERKQKDAAVVKNGAVAPRADAAER
jgi:hypothetical protein